jgi:hypothetical protein
MGKGHRLKRPSLLKVYLNVAGCLSLKDDGLFAFCQSGSTIGLSWQYMVCLSVIMHAQCQSTKRTTPSTECLRDF